MEFIGWISGTCLALCALPQVLECYRTKSAKGISGSFIGLWLSGEILGLIYILPKHVAPVLFNYVLNIVFLLIICYFKWRDYGKV